MASVGTTRSILLVQITYVLLIVRSDMNTTDFELFLRQENLAQNTITAYLYAVKDYFARYKELNKRNLVAHKSFLADNFKPKTVNLRILGLNKYLGYIGKSRLLEKNQTWYFAVRFLAATGARISELIHLKAEHIATGYYDIYTKGGKVRRIYIPKLLCAEAFDWLCEQRRCSGYVFLNQYGKRLTTRGIAQQLKNYAVKYGLNEKVVYPHSFRHRFAKNFLEKFNDISLLADLMGHESIETTRIYLRRSSAEQQEIVDKIITW